MPVKPEELDHLGDEYIIGWTSKITSYSGHGTKAMKHSDAVRCCEEMDKKYPDISHCVMTRQCVVLGKVVDRN